MTQYYVCAAWQIIIHLVVTVRLKSA